MSHKIIIRAIKDTPGEIGETKDILIENVKHITGNMRVWLDGESEHGVKLEYDCPLVAIDVDQETITVDSYGDGSTLVLNILPLLV